MSLIQRVTALAQAVAADIKALYAGKAEKGHTHTTAQITGLDSALESKASKAELTGALDLKVDKVTGKGLSDTNFTQVEKTKLTGIATGATKNRADTLNADKVHTHTTAQVTGLDTVLAGKADKTTQVIAGTGLTGGGTLAANRTLNVQYGTSAGTAAQGNDSRLSNSREWTAAVVSQAEAEAGTVTTARKWTAQRVRQAIESWWSGSTDKTKLDGIATGATANATDAQLRARSSHTGTQAISTVAGLDAALNGKVDTSDARLSDSRDWSATAVTQTEAEAGTSTTARKWTAQRVAQAISALGLKIGTTASTAKAGNWTPTWTEVSNKPSTFTPDSHTHSLSEVTDAGSLAALNTNASTSNFLRGDGAWVTPPNTTYSEISTAEISSGTTSTGRTISGRRMKYALDKKSDIGHGHSISDVTGLQAAIDSKANTSTQVTAGTGLSGGGSLETNRTLSVNYGTSAGTAAQGNDSRITGALQKSQVVQVTGTSTTNVMSQKAVTDAIAAGGGSGGGSVNVVQSDGFSVSAVMSQYAVTEFLYEMSIIANICWTYDKEQHAAIHALDPQTATLPQLIEALQSATLLDFDFEMPPPEP